MKTVADLERALQAAGIRSTAYALPGREPCNAAYALEKNYQDEWFTYYVHRNEIESMRYYADEAEAVNALYEMVMNDPDTNPPGR